VPLVLQPPVPRMVLVSKDVLQGAKNNCRRYHSLTNNSIRGKRVMDNSTQVLELLTDFIEVRKDKFSVKLKKTKTTMGSE